MPMKLSAAQIAALSPWLPMNAIGARGLLYEVHFPELDVATLERLRAEVRAMRARYRGHPAVLSAPVAVVGDDAPARCAGAPPATRSWWEQAWLVIDRDRGCSTEDAFDSLRSALGARAVLDVVGVYFLAAETLDEARRRARALATLRPATWLEGMNDRGPWVHWLAANAPLSSSSPSPWVAAPAVSATPGDEAVVAALAADWARCDALTPSRQRRAYPKAVRVGAEETMRTQLLRQIWSHHQGLGPDAAVLQRSLATLFSHWGKKAGDPWHDGLGVGARLPLVGLVAAIAAVDPFALFYEQRQRNAHLVEPPARTFTLPRDVDDAYATFEALLDEAIVTVASGTRVAREPALYDGLVLSPFNPAAAAAGILRFRVNAAADAVSAFTLPAVANETVRDLKARVSVQAGPHQDFFALYLGGRPLRLDEQVAGVVVGVDPVVDVTWTRCSHGAPTHPITGASACFWDGGASDNAEY